MVTVKQVNLKMVLSLKQRKRVKTPLTHEHVVHKTRTEGWVHTTQSGGRG